MSTICPGQDTRYWRPTDIFDVTCASCGAAVEFFKDDARRRCHSCGTLIQNPKISMGCAQWCEHARQCLGYDPKEQLRDGADEAGSLFDRLLDALKRRLDGDQEALGLALGTTEEVEALLQSEAAERRQVLIAALLTGVEAEARRQLCAEVGLEGALAKDVQALAAGEGPEEAAEARLLGDARRLLSLRRRLREGALPAAAELEGLATEAGRARAAKLLGLEG